VRFFFLLFLGCSKTSFTGNRAPEKRRYAFFWEEEEQRSIRAIFLLEKLAKRAVCSDDVHLNSRRDNKKEETLRCFFFCEVFAFQAKVKY
jgi:hypothetical protein